MGGNQFADHSISDEFDGCDELAIVACSLLHASLEDDSCPADFVDDIPGFTDRQGQRLFAVDVLASHWSP